MLERVRCVLESGGLSKEDALQLVDLPEDELFLSASELRRHFFDNKVDICFIINAKSGNCNMNCRFCSQSSFNSTQIEKYPFKSKEELGEIVSSWEEFPGGT